MTTDKHPNRRMKATLATILTVAVLTGSNLASASNLTRCGEALDYPALKDFRIIRAENQLLLTEYLDLQKTHKELHHEFKTLKGEVEPLRDAIRRKVEEQLL